jgi:hypothetical protein
MNLPLIRSLRRLSLRPFQVSFQPANAAFRRFSPRFIATILQGIGISGSFAGAAALQRHRSGWSVLRETSLLHFKHKDIP